MNDEREPNRRKEREEREAKQTCFWKNVFVPILTNTNMCEKVFTTVVTKSTNLGNIDIWVQQD